MFFKIIRISQNDNDHTKDKRQFPQDFNGQTVYEIMVYDGELCMNVRAFNKRSDTGVIVGLFLMGDYKAKMNVLIRSFI